MRKIEIINPSKKKKGLTKKELDKLLKKWQKKLMLDEWDIDIKIVEFQRKDYRQSGDFKANLKTKTASILMTIDPFLKNQPTIEKQEEQTIVHELVHILLWNFDSFNERNILNGRKKFKDGHDLYLEKLEDIVNNFTLILLKNEKG